MVIAMTDQCVLDPLDNWDIHFANHTLTGWAKPGSEFPACNAKVNLKSQSNAHSSQAASNPSAARTPSV